MIKVELNKKRFFLLESLFIFLAISLNAQEEGDIIKIGDTMPAFTIISDNGKEFPSSVLKGKVILINFFATWCPPCQKELADIQERLWPVYENHKDFSLLVIGREHNEEELDSYNKKKGFTFPLYPDKNREIYGKFAKSLIPRCYLIGKDGKIVYTSKGYTEEEFSGMMDKIQEALK